MAGRRCPGTIFTRRSGRVGARCRPARQAAPPPARCPCPRRARGSAGREAPPSPPVPPPAEKVEGRHPAHVHADRHRSAPRSCPGKPCIRNSVSRPDTARPGIAAHGAGGGLRAFRVQPNRGLWPTMPAPTSPAAGQPCHDLVPGASARSIHRAAGITALSRADAPATSAARYRPAGTPRRRAAAPRGRGSAPAPPRGRGGR